MKHLRKSGGFTLVELVVSIAVASLVTMAATTVLMLALRVNRQTSDTATQQYTVRALLTTMEKAATDGSIKGLVSDLDSWQLVDYEIIHDGNGRIEPFSARVVFGFDSETQTIYTSGTIDVSIDPESHEPVYTITSGIPVLRGVYASNARIENNLLSLSVETKEGVFGSTTFLRTRTIDSDIKDRIELEDGAVGLLKDFLDVLISQYGSTGKINYTVDNAKGADDPTYYSEWYIGQTYVNGVGQGGWNADTPWCACYVSWALVAAGKDYVRTVDGNEVHWYSHVDEFAKHFKMDTVGSSWIPSGGMPAVGSLIFFNFDNDEEEDHMGVVLNITEDDDGTQYVITIEGNSAGRVTMRRYKLTDERILGYGRLAGLETE